jgi:hypothetical protein
MIDRTSISPDIRFQGAANVGDRADKQQGPTCGFEAIENIVQLFLETGDELSSTHLLPLAQQHGVASLGEDGHRLALPGYHLLLQQFNIPARWYPFDHAGVIIPALSQNRVVLVVGEANSLNPAMYPWRDRSHAFVLTNYCVDAAETHVLGYVGLDSNVAGQEIVWPLQTIAAAAAWTTQNVMPFPVLITDIPYSVADRVRFYRQSPHGQCFPVL